MASIITTETMSRVLRQLYPKGKIWQATLPNDAGLEAKAELLAECQNFFSQLLEETDVRTALLALNNYGETYGIDVSNMPINTAHKLLFLKKNGKFDPTPENFKKLLQDYGANGSIEECSPFICGLSDAGSNDQCGDEEIRYMWFVNIDDGLYTEFRCGESVCGETLGQYDEGISELIKMIRAYAPAHGKLEITLE